MSMNPKSRERVVDVWKAAKPHWNDHAAESVANEFIDSILAAGFHVAEWRKVEEAESLTKYLTASGDRVDTGKYSQVLNRWCHVGHSNKPIAIKDLPEPPKAEGEG